MMRSKRAYCFSVVSVDKQTKEKQKQKRKRRKALIVIQKTALNDKQIRNEAKQSKIEQICRSKLRLKREQNRKGTTNKIRETVEQKNIGTEEQRNRRTENRRREEHLNRIAVSA